MRVYVSHWSVPLASAAEFVDTPFGCNLQHTLMSLQPFPALVRATMDATTNVALAIAIEHGRFAAMEQVL